MKKIAFIIFLAGFMLSCSGSKQGQTEVLKADTPEQVIDIHHAQNALDYQGVYTGTIPTFDGKATNIRVVLTSHEYTLHTTPLAERAETVIQKGEYTWDETGSIITLVGVESIPSKYFVAENQLRQLNKEGKQHSGKDAANYILLKQWSK